MKFEDKSAALQERQDRWNYAFETLKDPSRLVDCSHLTLDLLVERWKKVVFENLDPLPHMTFGKRWRQILCNDGKDNQTGRGDEIQAAFRDLIQTLYTAISEAVVNKSCPGVIRSSDFEHVRLKDFGFSYFNNITGTTNPVPYACGIISTLPADSHLRTLIPVEQQYLYNEEYPSIVLGPVQWNGVSRAWYLEEDAKRLTAEYRKQQDKVKADREDRERIEELNRQNAFAVSPLGKLEMQLKEIERLKKEGKWVDPVPTHAILTNGK